MAYYLGIDGGGSKTICAVGDETSQLEIVSAGPSNITRVGETRAREALQQAIRQACTAAKIEPGQVQRTCIGVAGAGRENVSKVVHQMIAEVIPGEIEVVGDMEIALTAAFGEGPGVIVIAGTGSIAYGRDAQGKTARAGGWGFAISDEGSAHWIGRTAVSSVLRAIDQGSNDRLINDRLIDDRLINDQRVYDRSINDRENAQAVAETLPLFRKLTAAWSVHSVDDFVRTANSNPDFAALLPTLIVVGDAGDAVSQLVLIQAGRELAQLAAIVVHRLFAKDNSNSSTIPIAIVGGVFRHSLRVRESFCTEVRKFEVPIDFRPQVIEPVAGAIAMARRAKGRG